VDNYCYGASFGLPFDAQVRSLRLFISDVMPHFRSDASRVQASERGPINNNEPQHETGIA
jgi:hypothetical protein